MHIVDLHMVSLCNLLTLIMVVCKNDLVCRNKTERDHISLNSRLLESHYFKSCNSQFFSFQYPYICLPSSPIIVNPSFELPYRHHTNNQALPLPRPAPNDDVPQSSRQSQRIGRGKVCKKRSVPAGCSGRLSEKKACEKGVRKSFMSDPLFRGLAC